MSKAKKKKNSEIAPLDWLSLIGYEKFILQVDRLWAERRVPPVVLLSGREGVGKRSVAGRILAGSYCEKGACGHCLDCLDLMHFRHPEVLWVETDESQLKLADIDNISDHLAIKASGGRSIRSVVIADVEKLTEQAVNRLLKTLEEPASGSQIIMTTGASGGLLDTLLSRAVQFRLAPPAHKEALFVLREALGCEANEDELLVLLKQSGGSIGTTIKNYENLSRVRGIDEAIGKCLFSDNQEWLYAAEELGKQYKVSVIELANRAEVILNQYYRHKLGVVEKSNFLDFSALKKNGIRHDWRVHLSKIRNLAGHGKIAINCQMAAESLNFSTEIKK